MSGGDRLFSRLLLDLGGAGPERVALAGERTARQKAVDNLYHAEVGEARALRTARVGGYREKVLNLLGHAARLDTPDRDPGELGREASTALGDFAGLEPVVVRDFDKPLTAMAVYPRSEWVAVGLADGTIRLYDPAAGGAWARLAEPHTRVTAMAATPEGRLLVGHANGTIRVVEFEPQSRTPRDRQTQGWRTNRRLLCGCRRQDTRHGARPDRDHDPRARRVWPIVLDLAHAIPGRPGGSVDPNFASVVVSPDGRLAATGLRFPEPPYFEIVVWELTAPRKVRHVSLALLSGFYQCAFQPRLDPPRGGR